MNDIDLKEIKDRARTAMSELLEAAELKPGRVVVVGCSTSEIRGQKIGSASDVDIAEAVMDGIWPLIEEHQLFLAVQCCEHLNRSLVMEDACAEKYGWEVVAVVPHLKAGGAFATEGFRRFKEPVCVESIKAHAGLDIGDTFIGMHLKSVAVPVRGSITTIGRAHVTMARTRPKLVGGERGLYRKYEDLPAAV